MTAQPTANNALRMIQQSPLFSALSEMSQQQMLQKFRPATWSPGTTSPTGHQLRFFYLLTAGHVELTRTHPHTGRAVTLMLLQPGDGFDVAALFDDMDNDLLATALSRVALLAVPVSTARYWMATHPNFNRACSLYLSRQFHTVQEFAADMALHVTATRLGKLILRLAIPAPQTIDNVMHRELTIDFFSQDALARMIGSSRIVVNRLLRQFREQNLISTDRGQLRVHDLRKLHAYCQELESE